MRQADCVWHAVDVNYSNPLSRLFRNFIALSPHDEMQLHALAASPNTKTARRDLIREGDKPHAVYLILEGWACRYKTLQDGRRQVLQFLLPSDLCDIHNVVLNEMDHSIGTITEVRYAEFPHERLEELVQQQPHLRRAFWWQSVAAMSMQREWTMNIGQRSASERLSHLFCELFMRLQATGHTSGHSCE